MHILTLHSPWFEMVKCGNKIYEGRRQTDKIKNINIGDYIIFYHVIGEKAGTIDETISPIVCIVQDKIIFETFEEALNKLPINDILPIDGITVDIGIEIYKKIVSIPTQLKDGVVMFKIKIV